MFSKKLVDERRADDEADEADRMGRLSATGKSVKVDDDEDEDEEDEDEVCSGSGFNDSG